MGSCLFAGRSEQGWGRVLLPLPVFSEHFINMILIDVVAQNLLGCSQPW